MNHCFLLGAEMMSLLKIKNVLKSSFGVNVKVHISHQKKFCKAMFIHFRFIESQSNVVESWWSTMCKKVVVLFKNMNADYGYGYI